jgi:hypothetical protein
MTVSAKRERRWSVNREVGTTSEVREVAAAVRRAQAEAQISEPRDVHYVQLTGPLLTPAAVADADKRGAKLVARETLCDAGISWWLRRRSVFAFARFRG